MRSSWTRCETAPRGFSITSYLAEGNVGAAARQLRSFRELLRVELGIEPAPWLTRLVADRLAERAPR